MRWAIRRREFWEEAVIYAKPHIIGQVVVIVAAVALYPVEFAAGAKVGAVAGTAWAIGKAILTKG